MRSYNGSTMNNWIILLILLKSGMSYGSSCSVSTKAWFQINPSKHPSALNQDKFVPLIDRKQFSKVDGLWIKLDIDHASCQQNLIWQLHDLKVSEIGFWQFQNENLIKQDRFLKDGDNRRYYPIRYRPQFEVPIQYQQQYTVYLRVNSNQRMTVNYNLITKEEHIIHEMWDQAIFLLFVGFAIGFSLYSLYLYASSKDLSYLHYFIFIQSIVMAIAIHDGNADWLIPLSGGWNRHLDIFIGLMCFFRVSFVRKMLPLPFQIPEFDKALEILARCTAMFVLIAMIPGSETMTQLVRTPLITTVIVVSLVASYISYSKSYQAALFMTIPWSFGAGIAMLTFLSDWGGFTESILTHQGYKIALCSEMMFLAMVLAYRINILQKDLNRLNESLENKIDDRTRQLKDANKRFQQNQAYLIEQEKFAAVGRIADALAHEVNTPLMIIRTGSSILANTSVDDKKMIDKRTSQINRAVDKIEKIIKALTITYLNPVMEKEGQVSVKSFLQSIIDIHSGMCLQNEITLKTDLADNLIIPGNPLHLADTLGDLIIASINAVSHAKERWIIIQTNQVKNDVIITIKDSCTVEQDDTRSKIFKDFERFDPTQLSITASSHDEGLGLGIAHQVIRSYGGTIKFVQNSFYTLTTIKFPTDIGHETHLKVS